MGDRPSDRAIAQAFDEAVPAGDKFKSLAAAVREKVYDRAREIDAAPINPQEADSKLIVEPSREHWRKAIQCYANEPLCVISQTLDAIEQYAQKLAWEERR